MPHIRCFGVALSLLLSAPVAAASPPAAELFAKHSEISDIALSPDGTRVAMAVPPWKARSAMRKLTAITCLSKFPV